MTDAELKKLFRLMMCQRRRKTIASLLSGNDIGCFSTAQYVERWNAGYEDGAKIMYLKLARMHLKDVPHLVREVKPDVWARSQETP